MRLRYVAMPTETAERFRMSGTDDFNNPVRAVTADSDVGYFCRHCLAQPGKGQDVLLGSYDPGQPKGHYWQPSPIFVHDGACPRYEESALPPAVRAIQLVNVRPYDASDRMLYHLNDTVTGDRIEALLERCFADERTRFANVHTGRPGCFLCRVERAS
ncbi:MAG TPA: DUF1203 domain-containing protein [Stellaceae bacterium]|jgi:hypothetical protein|nr:DUF1203 domain-containing protein [Stellaceae bacterium]